MPGRCRAAEIVWPSWFAAGQGKRAIAGRGKLVPYLVVNFMSGNTLALCSPLLLSANRTARPLAVWLMVARLGWLWEADIQAELDRRKPGTSRHVTQRREPDTVEILSGVFEGKTTGTPIGLLHTQSGSAEQGLRQYCRNLPPGHADYAYTQKIRFSRSSWRGRSIGARNGGSCSGRAVARKWLNERYGVEIRGG